MIVLIKENLWKQFGASIDMLGNAIRLYPEELWYTNKKFFYNAYHVLVFLDFYLTNPPDGFSSSLPFTLAEEGVVVEDAIDDVIPDRIYSKEELLRYLEASREKCRLLIAGLTEETLFEKWIEDPGTPRARAFPMFELLMYNMRHVQHHAAQLNMLLRREIGRAPGWVGRVRGNE